MCAGATPSRHIYVFSYKQEHIQSSQDANDDDTAEGRSEIKHQGLQLQSPESSVQFALLESLQACGQLMHHGIRYHIFGRN